MRTRTTIAGAAVVTLALIAPAGGQTLAPAAEGQDLIVNASVGAGYDEDVLAATAATSDPRAQIGGSYGLTDLRLSYSATSRRVSFGASGDSAFRFYRTAEPFTARRYAGSAGVSAALTTRLRASAALSAQRSSQHIFWIFPNFVESPLGHATLPSLDYSLRSAAGRSYDSSAALTYSLTRRSSVSAEYGYGNVRFGEEAFDLTRERWSGRYTHGLTRYASLRLGYGVEDATYSPGRRYRRRLIDAGLDYARPLSFSRRTTLKFGVGSAALDDGESTYSTITGNATLNHILSRRWTLGAAYNRGVGFVDGFVDPFVADSATVSLAGIVSRRVQINGAVSYSNGSVGVGAPLQRDYETYTGSTRINVRLGRGLGAFGEYVYYHYLFDPLVVLPLNSPRALDRQGVRGGVNYTLAIF